MTYRNVVDNVISLTGRRPPAPEALREVEAYWTSVADGRLVPSRSEIDPRGVVGALDRTFVLQQIAPGHARIRVAGSRLSQILDMDLRGMPFSALFHPAARPDLADALRALFAEPARISFRLESPGTLLGRAIRAECLVLPLRDDDGQITRAIGCIDWDPAASARRFRIVHQQRRTLIGFGEHPPEPQVPTPTPGARKRPTLTVVT